MRIESDPATIGFIGLPNTEDCRTEMKAEIFTREKELKLTFVTMTEDEEKEMDKTNAGMDIESPRASSAAAVAPASSLSSRVSSLPSSSSSVVQPAPPAAPSPLRTNNRCFNRYVSHPISATFMPSSSVCWSLARRDRLTGAVYVPVRVPAATATRAHISTFINEWMTRRRATTYSSSIIPSSSHAIARSYWCTRMWSKPTRERIDKQFAFLVTLFASATILSAVR